MAVLTNLLMKTYVLTISNIFPKTHKKAGLETNFIVKINSLLKKHTIRGNFLLWQIAYSEIYITDTLWPDFNEEELDKAIEVFNKRDRRFGGVK